MPELSERYDGTTLDSVFPDDLDKDGNFKVPDGVKVIGKMAFSKNVSTMLRSVTLPEGLVKIDRWAFKHSRIKHLVIPSSVKTIFTDAFEDCWDLETIDVRSTDINIYFAFCNCRSVKKVTATQMVSDAIWSQCVLHWDERCSSNPLIVFNNTLKRLKKL